VAVPASKTGAWWRQFPPPAALFERLDLPPQAGEVSSVRGARFAKPYLTLPARLSRKTPCSPNMFQNHQGALNRSGRP
jgi:hypothetical protein